MSNDHFAKFAQFLAENPGSTASEAGLTSVEATRLEQAGRIVRVGSRQTGKPGRRPIEYALPGQEGVTADARVTEAQDKAKARVSLHDRYWVIANRMWRLREAGQRDSDEYRSLVDEKEAIKEANHGEIPESPSKTEYVLAGVIMDDEIDGPDASTMLSVMNQNSGV